MKTLNELLDLASQDKLGENVKVLVPISGGKDSQLCLKLALEQHPPSQVRGLFCDTKNEHPDTYAHVEKLRSMYGDIVIDVTKTASVRELIIKYGRFPGGGGTILYR